MIMYPRKEYCKTFIGREWEVCALALVLQMSELKKEIKKHEEAIKNLTSSIKEYDTIHYKINGYYINIKPDCYIEEESEEE